MTHKCCLFILHYIFVFSGFVTDFDFSPFRPSLLASGAEDRLAKLWELPEGGVSGVYSSPMATFGPFEVALLCKNIHQ